MHDVLASDKQAKQFTQLKRGQKLEFELGPDGQLNNLHSKVNDLESITLTKGPKASPSAVSPPSPWCARPTFMA